MKIKFILICLLAGLFIVQSVQAQYMATSLIPLRDSTVAGFVNIHDLYFLKQDENKKLDKYISKILKTSSFQQQAFYLNKILAMRNSVALCVLGLDYFFKQQPPTKGTNVERFLDVLHQHNMYPQINQVMQYDLPLTEGLKDSVQKRIGWQYGYGAYYYISPEDSIYIEKMKKVDVHTLDEAVIHLIESYLEEQTYPFRYDVQNLVRDIDALPFVEDVIHDGCLTKTLQLPNWDQIGVLYIQGRDTVERVYTLQIGNYHRIRFSKWFSIPIKNGDYVRFQKVGYGLHYIERTRKQCEENARQRNLHE